jgi:hypothetical protein
MSTGADGLVDIRLDSFDFTQRSLDALFGAKGSSISSTSACTTHSVEARGKRVSHHELLLESSSQLQLQLPGSVSLCRSTLLCTYPKRHALPRQAYPEQT